MTYIHDVSGSSPLFRTICPRSSVGRATHFVIVEEMETRYGLAIKIVSSNLTDSSIMRGPRVRVAPGAPSCKKLFAIIVNKW